MSLKTPITRRLLPAAISALVVLALATVAYASGHGGEAAGAAGATHHASSLTDEKFWDFIYRVMNFAVLFIVLFFLLRKPMSQGLKQRTANIKAELEELEAKREEAKRQYAILEARLKEVEKEREAILEEFRAQGEREKEKIIQEARAMAERIKAQAQFTIEQETEAAKSELKREIAEMSAALAEDLLKQNINDDDQVRLVDEYLERVQREAQ